tara:strand:- start:413 stop:730 length:318 start_codon:yes stop_codon:yes gene_type:complete
MFKVNPRRTFRYPVTVTIHDGEKAQTGKFHATFRAAQGDELRSRSDDLFLDIVLLEVHGIEIEGEDGQPLEGEDLLAAVKNDPSLSSACIAAYQESIVRKNRPKT